MKKIISSFLFCLFVTASVYAEEPKYYFGASYLIAEADLMGETDNDSGFEARFGYILNKNFSLKYELNECLLSFVEGIEEPLIEFR